MAFKSCVIGLIHSTNLTRSMPPSSRRCLNRIYESKIIINGEMLTMTGDRTDNGCKSMS